MNTIKTIYLISEDEQLIRNCREAINSIDPSIVIQVSVTIDDFNASIVKSGLSNPCIIVAEISSVKGFSEMETLLTIGSSNGTPVVMVSESFENGLEELILNYGDMRYYTKPLSYKTVEFFFKELIADRLS
jgi:ribosome-interacting GTPase 1